MAIKELIALVPPPNDPLNGDGDWGAADAEFGIHFPSDFRTMIRHYGTGEFGLGNLLISNPLTEAGRQEMQKNLWTLRVLRDACEIPLIIHPDRPGLLPWGRDGNGNIFCWLTQGKPAHWPIVQVGHNDENNPQQADVNITTFLVKYAHNQYPAMLGGLSFDQSQSRFEKGRPWER
jgi:hypothetical protein